MNKPWDSLIRERQQELHRRFGNYVTSDQFIALSGMTPRMLKRLIRMELIERVWVDGQAMYRVEKLPRARKMLRLHYDLGVGWTSMDLVLRLLDRLDELERRL